TAQVRRRFGEVVHGDRLDARERRLGARLGRTEKPVDSELPSAFGDREDAADMTHTSVERKLADSRVLRQRGRRDLTRCGEDRQGDREIEARPFLAQLRRSEIDRDPALRPLELGRRDAAADTLVRFTPGWRALA